MKDDDHAAHVQATLASLDVRFDYDAASRSLRVAYSVKNLADAPLMALDRGVAVGGKATSAAPFSKLDGDALTLSQQALALPKPAPTVPRVALATRIERGATHAGETAGEVPDSVRRVRYCLGVAPFSEGAFTRSKADATVWRASFAVADSQALLCTPWFDVVEIRFLRE